MRKIKQSTSPGQNNRKFISVVSHDGISGTNCKKISKQTLSRSRKIARRVVDPLDEKAMKGILKMGREMAGKRNEICASALATEDVAEGSIFKPLFSGRVSETGCQRGDKR